MRNRKGYTIMSERVNELKRLLEALCLAFGPSGRETAVADLIRKELEGTVDEIKTDALGNLIAIKRCGKPDAKRLMLASHMDQIGIIASYIDEKGFVRFQMVGGVSPHLSVARKVHFESGAVGVIGRESIDEIGKLDAKHLYVDLGVKTREEAEKLVSIGDFGCFDHHFFEMGDCYACGAMDDRAACAVTIEALRRVKAVQSDIYAVFTVQEEVGLRGAQVSGYSVAPHAAIALDVTLAGDTPEAKPPLPMKLGAGPCVKVKDRSVLCHPAIKNWMSETAEKNGIPYQYEVLLFGGTDAGAIHTTRGGVPSGVLSIATRYIHSSFETLDKNDLNNSAELLARLLESELPV